MAGIPYFQEVVVHREGGDIRFVAYDLSETNIYVEKILVNGKTLVQPFIQIKQLQQGATIEFYLTATPHPNPFSPPSPSWGSGV